MGNLEERVDLGESQTNSSDTTGVFSPSGLARMKWCFADGDRSCEINKLILSEK